MRGRIFESLMHLYRKIVYYAGVIAKKIFFLDNCLVCGAQQPFCEVYNQYFLVQIEDFVNNALNFCPELGHLRPEIAWRRFELENRDNIGTNSRYFVLDQQICCT